MSKKNESKKSIQAIKNNLVSQCNLIKSIFSNVEFENGEPKFSHENDIPIFELSASIARLKVGAHLINEWASDVDIASLTIRIFIDTYSSSPRHDVHEHFSINNDKIFEQYITTLAETLHRGPQPYTVCIPTIGLPSLPPVPIQLSSDTTIGQTSSSFINLCGHNTADRTQQTAPLIPCITITSKGLIGSSPNSPVIRSALSTFKHIIVLGHILGLISIRPKLTHFPASSNTTIDKFQISGPHINTITANLPYTILSALNTSSLTDKGTSQFNSLCNGNNSKTAELEKLQICLDGNDKNLSRIKASLEWAFESLFLEDTTSSFVMLCLAIESMIGDQDTRRNTKELLASRFAFSLGKTYDEKMSIHKAFTNFYDKRSKIIHGAQSSLSYDEVSTLHKFRDLLFAIIYQELDGITNNISTHNKSPHLLY